MPFQGTLLTAAGVATACCEDSPAFMKLSSARGVLPGAGRAASSPCAWQEELKEAKDSLQQQQGRALGPKVANPFASHELRFWLCQ